MFLTQVVGAVLITIDSLSVFWRFLLAAAAGHCYGSGRLLLLLLLLVLLLLLLVLLLLLLLVLLVVMLGLQLLPEGLLPCLHRVRHHRVNERQRLNRPPVKDGAILQKQNPNV